MSLEEDGLMAFESELGSLMPVRSQIDRNHIMFIAGKTVARRAVRERTIWIAVAASLAIVALGEGTLLLSRPAIRIVERVVVVHDVPTAPLRETIPLAAANSAVSTTFLPVSLGFGRTAHELQARQLFLYGLDGLPDLPQNDSSEPQNQPESSRRLLREKLIKDLNLGDHS